LSWARFMLGVALKQPSSRAPSRTILAPQLATATVIQFP
jgi:hypothetical protein